MQIRFLAPLRAAYARMRSALFRPFSFERWMYFGFACWVAGWGAGSSFASYPLRNRIDTHDLPGTWQRFTDLWADAWSDPVSRGLLYLLAFLLVVLFVVSIWVQSRGEFVFLETTARDRLAFWAPWREYSREGNSMFVWRLVLQSLGLVSALAIGFAVWRLALGGRIPESLHDVAWHALIAIVVFLWLPVTLLLLFVLLLLRHFVAPIMYRDRVGTNEAWRRFLALFRAQPGDFVLYALFVLGLLILTTIGLTIATCLTCCVLGCILAIPFVGTVLYLPVSYTFRALGPEFLAQFPSEPPVLSPLVPAPPPLTPQAPLPPAPPSPPVA
jgi:hypothetical protein